MEKMFNTSETMKANSKSACNKLLLLILIISFSPLSHEMEQQQSQVTTPSSSAVAATQSSSPADNLITKRDFELVFENFTCTLNDKWVVLNKMKQSTLTSDRLQNMEKLSCSLTKNAKRRNLQMEMSFKRPVNQFNFNILIILQRPRHLQQSQFVLLNLTSINGCDLLALKNQVTLMHWARTILQHYSNFPQNCPFNDHSSYYVRNFKWDIQQMPSFYVEAPMIIEFSYIFDNSTKLSGLIHAKLELKSNKKFSIL